MPSFKLYNRNIGVILSLLMLFNLLLVFIFDNYLVIATVFVIGLCRLVYDRFDFLKPSSGFLLPWILLFIFLNLPITTYSREIDSLTLKLMCIPVSLSVIISTEFIRLKNGISKAVAVVFAKNKYNILLFVGLILFMINFLASGFLPLINSIQTGNSDYFDYGVKGLNGMFYAYANALCLLSYMLYLDTNKKKYIVHVGIIMLIFLLCLTRQNIISAVTEIFILHSFKRGLISKKKMLIYVSILLFAFGALGELRSGDIKGIMGLKEEFFWLPTAFIWVYSYGFFNLLNLDNLVTSKIFGIFDGSSTSNLIPSFFRPKFESQPDLLEVINFNISSYLNPILRDWGFSGVFIFTVIVVFLTVKSYQYAKNYSSFKSIGIYCVLLFCALFSFFINFWFYLPIIFQIPFILIFNNYVFRNAKK
jgi:oligosaccharide repeat unit polymerase